MPYLIPASPHAFVRSVLVGAAIVAQSPIAGSAAAAETVELARGQRALLPVVIGPEAPQAVKDTAAELADYLGRLAGAKFQVETGDGSTGIALGRPEDFAAVDVAFGEGPFAREDYRLRSHAAGVQLIGASEQAVAHAAWDLLHRLGYRQFFPGETWEVIPRLDVLAIAVDERESPSFHARRIWYNWGLWGYNNEPYHQWCRRNRAVQGFQLQSGHAYEAIIAANRSEFDQHPEYLALVDGERKMRDDVKFCVANPGLRKLVVDHAVRYFEQHPHSDSISMDPSDGGGWCECAACGELGSVSNRVVTLANDVAEAINAPALGAKYVGMYAYNQHAAPPTVRVHPRVIPSAATAFIGGGFTFDQVVEGWQAQGATMGVYDYLSVVDWDWNLPRGAKAAQPSQIAAFLPRIHRQGVRFYDAEAGDCWGPCGLGYYVTSRVLWDVREGERREEIVEDFLDKAFGEAREPMREFYRLISEDRQRRPPSDIVGRMYRQLDAARRATDDVGVRRRIDDLILYTRHAELYYALANGSGSVEEVCRHAYRMRTTMMVHSYGLWARLLSQQAAHTYGHPLKSDAPFTAEEIDKLLADGIANNRPSDPGFESVAFSRRLVPAGQRLKLPDVPAGSFPTEAQEQQRYAIWVAEGTKSVDLQVRVDKVWANRQPQISLYSPLEVTLDPVATNDNYRPDGKLNSIRLATSYQGLHFVETVDGGDYTRIEWPAGLPVTIESGIDSPGVTSHFRGPWTLYFYVPRGTKTIGGWASRIANWAPRISGKLIDPEGRAVLDFAEVEEGWFNVPVPAGQDGRLWKFQESQGQRLLMTVPPYLARNGAELLLPAEVVERDTGNADR